MVGPPMDYDIGGPPVTHPDRSTGVGRDDGPIARPAAPDRPPGAPPAVVGTSWSGDRGQGVGPRLVVTLREIDEVLARRGRQAPGVTILRNAELRVAYPGRPLLHRRGRNRVL